jgi:gamma-glutamylcyclotransferase (GGCT)/AIG2-like uncharacterized protein YtfP
MLLFAYGTLLIPEVMEVVAGRRLAARAAVLRGFRRRLLRGAVYPAVLPAPGEDTEGVVWSGLDQRALARLDRFEGELYERRRLAVELAEGGACEAFVYVLEPRHRALATDAPWELEVFRARHLRDYLAACHAFVRELDAR